jgi:hypothetical protein
MSNKKIVTDPFMAIRLVAVQIASKSQVYGLTVLTGNTAGLAIPFRIIRLKCFSNWASIGLDGSMRTIAVEGS